MLHTKFSADQFFVFDSSLDEMNSYFESTLIKDCSSVNALELFHKDKCSNFSFSNASNYDLLMKTKSFAKFERHYELLVLQGLQEIEARLLHLERGYSSLEQFAIEELGYHSSSAYRKVAAMRLLSEIPEIKTSIDNAEISVTTLSQAQSFFRAQSKQKKAWDKPQKLGLLHSLKGKSKLQAEKLLKSLDPEAPTPDRMRVISSKETEIKFTADDALLEKLQRVRELLSHSQCNNSYNDLFHKIADIALERLDLGKRQIRKEKNNAGDQIFSQAQPPFTAVGSTQMTSVAAGPRQDPASSDIKETLSPPHSDSLTRSCASVFPPVGKSTRFIPLRARKKVWNTDNSQCSYVDSVTGRRCDSRWKLQIDHRIPWAKCGSSAVSNLRLLCANHNFLAASHSFGRNKMQRYRSKKS